MSTFSQLTYHIVFSTKYRRKLISEWIREPLYEYMGGIIRQIDGSLIEIGGVDDHVHLLTHLPAKTSVSDCVRTIKANASKWLNDDPERSTKFQWQTGFGGFTVSYSQVEVVKRYIQNQAEHHRSRSY